MIDRLLLVALVVGACFVTASSAQAREVTRKEIRQMPILERPSRPGHFYGNTVRRNTRGPHRAVPQLSSDASQTL
ncbi:MAG TPA: hypothetical protein VHV08_03345, partial [Pirellulales bacterium]|nr:hypothetical protein [Pirellulales bacterium]